MGRNHKKMEQYISKHPTCELCGSDKGIECHHILPLCMEGYGVSLDRETNYLAVCRKCHALLTPRDLLSEYGVAKARYGGIVLRHIEARLHETIGCILDDGDSVDVIDVLGIFDRIVNEWLGKDDTQESVGNIFDSVVGA